MQQRKRCQRAWCARERYSALALKKAVPALQDALIDALATDEQQHIVPSRLALVEAAWLLDQVELNGDFAAAAGVTRVTKKLAAMGVAKQSPRKSRGPYMGVRNHPLGLTNKDQKILRLLARGYTNRETSN